MTESPRIRVVRGSASPQEEEAVRRAILHLWREERAKSVEAVNPWVAAARAEATGRSASSMRTPGLAGAWRLSGRLSDGVATPAQTGRADAI